MSCGASEVRRMKKRYIPAFILEGVATAIVVGNLVEVIAGKNILLFRPGLWAIWLFVTVATAPAFILYLMDRREGND